MKKTFKSINFILVGILFFTSCEKDFDTPPIETVSVGSIKTIADIRAMHVPGETVKIAQDISVYGVVTIDESTGNLFKETYITDETGNLYLRFNSNSGLFIGDSVRINLKGANILKFNQMLQIDSLHSDNSVVKISTQNFKTPELLSISDLFDANGDALESSQGKLVQFNDVFFSDAGQLTYADGATQSSGSRNLISLAAEDIEIRTSGFANFADVDLPNGVGSFIGVVNQHNTGLQVIVRNTNEVIFSGVTPEVKTFDDQSISTKNWSTQLVTGSTNWETSNQGASSYYGTISNFDGQNNSQSEAWLISPSFDISTSASPFLSFKNASNFSGPQLQVLVSTNYDGTSIPSSATWTPVTANLSSGGFMWVLSGIISLTPFISANTYIAFKYTGSGSDGSTWELDNIIINK